MHIVGALVVLTASMVAGALMAHPVGQVWIPIALTVGLAGALLWFAVRKGGEPRRMSRPEWVLRGLALVVAGFTEGLASANFMAVITTQAVQVSWSRNLIWYLQGALFVLFGATSILYPPQETHRGLLRTAGLVGLGVGAMFFGLGFWLAHSG